MATYLFFLGVGTYDTFVREFEYPDGATFNLELLCPPGTRKDIAAKSLDMLFDGIMWIYLYTGRDKYKNKELADKLYDLVYEREKKKTLGEDVSEIRERLKTLGAESTWGYKYTGSVYREIGMQNSNFGGMENVGNTTISTNRLLPHPDSSDGILEYVQRVKTHEFYHNLNGSEVTGMTPFEIWLNEAVTVHIEKEHHAFTFGDDYSRLQEVLGIISPDGGVLQLDTGALAMAIIPEGFNSPDELITSVTYVKAPEFVGMVETILGKENFVKGLADYHQKFHHGNATTNDWLEAMQAYTDVNLSDFANSWLYKTGYPVVQALRTFNEEEQSYTISLQQEQREDGTFWQFPFIVALCDEQGNAIEEKKVFVDAPQFTITFNQKVKPAFVSMNRGYTFFGKLTDSSATDEELWLQLKHDTDIVAKYMAYYQLWDKEKTRLLLDDKNDPDNALIDVIVEFLQDEDLMQRVGTQFLARFESVEDDRFTHDYEAVYQVRRRISEAVAKRHESTLLELYQKANTSQSFDTVMKQLNHDIKSRQIKNVCLAFLAHLDTPEIHALTRKQWNEAKVASERNLPASLYVESSAPDREEFIEEFKNFGKENLLRWEVFLSIMGRSDANDVVEQIKKIEKMPEFRIDQANDSRGLYLGFARNRRISLLTASGRGYFEEVLKKISVVNEFTAVHMLKQLAHIDKLPSASDRAACYAVLTRVEEHLNSRKNEFPMAYNNVKRLLETCTKSKADFEAQ
jgi:aminopeptidase N